MLSITKTWLLYTWNDYKMLMEDFYMFSISFYKLAIAPLVEGHGSLFLKQNLNFLYPRMLYAKFGWNGPVVLENFCFKYSPYIFIVFAFISPWGRVWVFICKNLHPIYLRMLCVKLKEMIFNIFNIILLFRFKLPF